MPSLRELQQAFALGVFDAEESGIAPYIVERGLPAGARLQIYRNNTREGFHGQLAATYPVLCRLVGEAYFRQMAWAYQRRYPSASGNLFHAGLRLAEFLQAELGPDSEHAYLADVARLEWACHDVQHAAEGAGLDPARLAAVAAESHGDLCLALAPAARLVSSQYPVFRIWRSNQPAAIDEEPIDLRAGGDRVLVRRDGEGIELRQLSAGSYALLAAIAAGFPLMAALQAALDVESGLAIDVELRRWATLGVIADFRTPEPKE